MLFAVHQLILVSSPWHLYHVSHNWEGEGEARVWAVATFYTAASLKSLNERTLVSPAEFLT